MRFPAVKRPQAATLARYGFRSVQEWEALLEAQGGTCAVCGRVPKSGRLTTDHEHVKRWVKLPPEERVRYVRGLLCFFCNRYWLAGQMTVERAEAVAAYLRAYRARRPIATPRSSAT